MASAQVLPNSGISSKKQQQLEAGKKRLEEFRRKKAAKKAASNNSLHPANGELDEEKPSVSESIQLTDGSSNARAGSFADENEKKKKIDVVREAEPGSVSVSRASPSISSYTYSPDSGQTYSADEKLRDHGAPYESVLDHAPHEDPKDANFGLNDDYGIHIGQSAAFHPLGKDINGKSSHFRLEDGYSNNSDDRLKDFTNASSVASQAAVTNSSIERYDGASFTKNFGHNEQLGNGPVYKANEVVLSELSYKMSYLYDSSTEVGKSLDGMFKYGSTLVPSMGGRKHGNPIDNLASESSTTLWSLESRSTAFLSDAVPSSNQAYMPPAVTGRRSRPSFLDSIMSRSPSGSLPYADTEKANTFSSKIHPVDGLTSSASTELMNSSVANGGDLFKSVGSDLTMESKRNDYSTKQNEDFAALEQHIEDLTQEKFSLQRALEASRVLAESLATENSALTDSYNQQGGVVSQLKSDMEKLQEELRAQLAELEAVRIEYGNAQLECSAADERAKLLASEVIGLEEKALRLRSNELKLERELENLQAEMSSQKRRISSLEKERQDLQSTIDALQEEKKLLQSKLRKAPTSGKAVDIKKSPTNRKEASTSTEDLVNEDEDPTLSTSNVETAAVLSGSDTSSSSNPQSRLFGLEVSSLSIPPDQTRMIENINTLISELALEKEELMRALSAESSQSSKLKDLNKELTQKLEAQTQRLELLTSKSMASDNIPARKSESRTMVDNTQYADEGDEVVERVLGWIMKLFPGGPSRRQAKHL